MSKVWDNRNVRHHKYQVTDNHDRINNLPPADAVFKTFMFTPETARDFLENIYQSRCASFATCKPYAWNP